MNTLRYRYLSRDKRVLTGETGDLARWSRTLECRLTLHNSSSRQLANAEFLRVGAEEIHEIKWDGCANRCHRQPRPPKEHAGMSALPPCAPLRAVFSDAEENDAFTVWELRYKR